MDGRAQASLLQMSQWSGGVSALEAAGQDFRQVDDRARRTRRCARCATPSVGVVHITFHFRAAIPLGRTYRHRCTHCARQLCTESPLRALVQIGFSSVLILVGSTGAAASSSGRGFAVMGAVALLGVLALGRSTWRIVQLVRNPPLDEK